MLRKIISILSISAFIMTTPGLEFYSAWGQGSSIARTSVRVSVAKPAPLLKIPVLPGIGLRGNLDFQLKVLKDAAIPIQAQKAAPDKADQKDSRIAAIQVLHRAADLSGNISSAAKGRKASPAQLSRDARKVFEPFSENRSEQTEAPAVLSSGALLAPRSARNLSRPTGARTSRPSAIDFFKRVLRPRRSEFVAPSPVGALVMLAVVGALGALGIHYLAGLFSAKAASAIGAAASVKLAMAAPLGASGDPLAREREVIASVVAKLVNVSVFEDPSSGMYSAAFIALTYRNALAQFKGSLAQRIEPEALRLTTLSALDSTGKVIDHLSRAYFAEPEEMLKALQNSYFAEVEVDLLAGRTLEHIQKGFEDAANRIVNTPRPPFAHENLGHIVTGAIDAVVAGASESLEPNQQPTIPQMVKAVNDSVQKFLPAIPEGVDSPELRSAAASIVKELLRGLESLASKSGPGSEQEFDTAFSKLLMDLTKISATEAPADQVVAAVKKRVDEIGSAPQNHPAADGSGTKERAFATLAKAMVSLFARAAQIQQTMTADAKDAQGNYLPKDSVKPLQDALAEFKSKKAPSIESAEEREAVVSFLEDIVRGWTNLANTHASDGKAYADAFVAFMGDIETILKKGNTLAEMVAAVKERADKTGGDSSDHLN